MTDSHIRRRGKIRASFQWPVIAVLTLTWTLLWGKFTPLVIVGGMIVTVGVLAIFPLPPVSHPVRVRPLKVVVLVARFGYDLVVASVRVAALALRFGYEPHNAVIEVHLHSRSDLVMTITGELICLIPGSLLVETSRTRSVLFLHVLGVHDEQDVRDAREHALEQERRIVEAFATDADLAAYRARAATEADR